METILLFITSVLILLIYILSVDLLETNDKYKKFISKTDIFLDNLYKTIRIEIGRVVNYFYTAEKNIKNRLRGSLLNYTYSIANNSNGYHEVKKSGRKKKTSKYLVAIGK